jgi:hypothetical protein
MMLGNVSSEGAGHLFNTPQVGVVLQRVVTDGDA